MNENYQTPLFRIALRRSIPVRNRPWNHPFEYTRAEQKRNKPHRTKGRAWKERKKTRSVHSRLSLVAPPPIPRGGTLVFTGVRERDLSAPWEHEKCRSQPTSFWFTVDERQREREEERRSRTFLKRGNSSIGEQGYLFFAMRGHPPIF